MNLNEMQEIGYLNLGKKNLGAKWKKKIHKEDTYDCPRSSSS
jgi:hypothetical protein